MSSIITFDPRSKDENVKTALSRAPISQRILLGVYLTITRLLPTKLILYLVRRASKTNPEESFERANERVSINLTERPVGKLYWMNSIGPGDSTANQALLAKVLSTDPTAIVLVTTRTVSAQGIFSRWKHHPRVITQLAPHDGLYIARRFLDHWKPSVAIFCERDLWPNMLTELRLRRLPTAIVNGQLDGRLLQDFGKLQELSKWFLAHIDFIHFTTEASINIGKNFMRPDAIQFLGKNLKLDCEPLPSKSDLSEHLNAVWGERKIFTAASVATREVRIVLDAFMKAHRQDPNLRMILVPRWKEQADDFLATAKELGLDVPRRSIDDLPQQEDPVFIADSYGELGNWYEASYAAFIGNTFHKGEGHNAYEAILKGIPIVAGGIGRQFKDDFEDMVSAGVGIITPDAKSLRDAIIYLTTDPLRNEVQAYLSNQGTAAKVTELLTHLR